MKYVEQEDSMPAFIRDVKAYNEIQMEYHSQHANAIRQLQEKNKEMNETIRLLEQKINSLELLIK